MSWVVRAAGGPKQIGFFGPDGRIWCGLHARRPYGQPAFEEDGPRDCPRCCKTEHCLRGVHAKGLCRRCYDRARRRKTISRAELSRLSFCNSDKIPSYVEIDGVRKWWSGIGWVGDKPARGDEVLVVD